MIVVFQSGTTAVANATYEHHESQLELDCHNPAAADGNAGATAAATTAAAADNGYATDGFAALAAADRASTDVNLRADGVESTQLA